MAIVQRPPPADDGFEIELPFILGGWRSTRLTLGGSYVWGLQASVKHTHLSILADFIQTCSTKYIKQNIGNSGASINA